MEKVNVMYSAAEVHADISLYAAEFKKEWESFSEEDEKAILARRRLLTMGFSSSSSIHSLDAHIYGVLDKRIFDWYQERFPNSTFLKVDDFTTLLQKYNLVCNRHTCYRGEVSENTMDELEHLKGKLEMRSKENTFSNVCTNYNTILRVTERPMDIGVVEYTINKVEYPIRCDRFMEKAEGCEKALKSSNVLDYEIKDTLDKSRRYSFYHGTPIENTDLFIAAPFQEMACCRQAPLNKDVKTDTRPLVFQLFPYGIVIFGIWGMTLNK